MNESKISVREFDDTSDSFIYTTTEKESIKHHNSGS